MKELYKELYKCFDKDKLKDCAHFVAMRGSKYIDCKTKLFIVGRAANGWSQLAHESAEEFGRAAEAEFQEKQGFQWIDEENKRFIAKPKDSDKSRYFLSKSPFWRTIEQICRKMNILKSEDARFFDYIAWSNLYKISPNNEGNPDNCMCKKQLEVCRKILKREIEEYDPTHILLITDYDRWFANEGYNFSELFETNRIGSNYEKSLFLLRERVLIHLEVKRFL